MIPPPTKQRTFSSTKHTLLKKLLQEVELVNKRHRLLKKGDALVAGVSGGPDSVALLTLLSKLRHKYSLRITVAHLNHGFVKKESIRCQWLVKRIAEGLGLPLHIKKMDIKNLAKRNKRSVEEMGRIERYKFFESVAKKTKSNKIATAHTLDDQAETMLLRIFRGSGLRGLAGIPYKRGLNGRQVIRPLLSSEKKDLQLLLKENRIPFHIDKTNRSFIFTRNRLRHYLLPKIAAHFNPQIKKTLSHLQIISSDIQDYLEKVSLKIFKRCIYHDKPRKLSLKLSALKKLHPAILREVLLTALLKKRGDLKRLSYYHLAGILDILCSSENHLELYLPDHIKVKKNSKSLDFIT